MPDRFYEVLNCTLTPKLNLPGAGFVIEISNQHGETITKILTPADADRLTSFRKWCYTTGIAIFAGSEKDLQQLYKFFLDTAPKIKLEELIKLIDQSNPASESSSPAKHEHHKGDF